MNREWLARHKVIGFAFIAIMLLLVTVVVALVTSHIISSSPSYEAPPASPTWQRRSYQGLLVSINYVQTGSHRSISATTLSFQDNFTFTIAGFYVYEIGINYTITYDYDLNHFYGTRLIDIRRDS